MELGRLEPLDIRSVWQSEARQFTPWLLANHDQLAEALGIDLELERSEHPVGGFSLDLIGRDLTNDAVLIVENQLEITDHSHLGQLVTYAAGTGAATIVWISTAFRQEHRQALDWLNQQTNASVRFFGIELAALHIGDSLPAPFLRVVAEPNDWQKQVRAATQSQAAGTKTASYLAFWTKYLDEMHKAHPDWSRTRTPSSQNWMSFPSPVSRTGINPSFATGDRLRHEIYIDCGDGTRNKALFAHLLSQRAAFEAAYGRPLEWEELPSARASRIAEYRSHSDVLKAEEHSAYISWFLDAGVRLRLALAAVDTTWPTADSPG